MNENNNFWKMVTTVSIWVLIAGMAITGMVASPAVLNSESIETIVIGSMIMATVSTGFIWVLPEVLGDRRSSAKTVAIENSEKAKRGGKSSDDKLAILLELMDEDERQAFKDSLKRRYMNDVGVDGELPYDFYDDEILTQIEDN